MKKETASTRFLPGLFAQPRWKTLLTHPDDVLGYPGITTGQKRAILAAWASDAHAVADSPTLRQLPNGAVVKLDDILHALRSLDGSRQKAFLGHMQRVALSKPGIARRARRASFVVAGSRNENDGGDEGGHDPPSAPAAAARRAAAASLH